MAIELNETHDVFQKLVSHTAAVRDAAAEGVSGIFRTTAWEASPVRELLGAKTITFAECDRLPTTTKPVKFDLIEHGVEQSITIPFGGQPVNSYMHLPMFITTFARNVSARIYDDKDNLPMYGVDIEKFFYTLLLRECMDREFRAFIASINFLVGALNDPDSDASVMTGGLAHASVGALNRSSLNFAMKSFPATYGNLAPKLVLLNNSLVYDLLDDMDADGIGDTLAEKAWLEGYAVIKNAKGLDVMVTLKNRVVQDDEFYILTDPEHLGRMYILQDTTLVNKVEDWWLSMFVYLTEGGVLPNAGAFRKFNCSADNVAVNSFKVEDYVPAGSGS